MARRVSTLAAILLGLAALANSAAAQPGPVEATRRDARTVLRTEVEDELAQLRPRLAVIEGEAKAQADRYKDMAAKKAEEGKKAAAKTAAAKARGKPATPVSGGAARPGAKDSGKAGSAPGGAGAGGGGAGGAGAAAGQAEAKKIDPVLTQQFVVLQMRDEIRQLRDRIAYLESVLARL